MHKYIFPLLILPFLVGTATGGEPAPETQPERCISLAGIKRMTIVGERHLHFEMHYGRHFLNTLPAGCSALRQSRAIMYRTSLNRLCDVDIITVLDDVGPGFRPMGSCGLGRFEPVSDEEIRKLKTELKAKREQK